MTQPRAAAARERGRAVGRLAAGGAASARRDGLRMHRRALRDRGELRVGLLRELGGGVGRGDRDREIIRERDFDDGARRESVVMVPLGVLALVVQARVVRGEVGDRRVDAPLARAARQHGGAVRGVERRVRGRRAVVVGGHREAKKQTAFLDGGARERLGLRHRRDRGAQPQRAQHAIALLRRARAQLERRPVAEPRREPSRVGVLLGGRGRAERDDVAERDDALAAEEHVLEPPETVERRGCVEYRRLRRDRRRGRRVRGHAPAAARRT